MEIAYGKAAQMKAITTVGKHIKHQKSHIFHRTSPVSSQNSSMINHKAPIFTREPCSRRSQHIKRTLHSTQKSHVFPSKEASFCGYNLLL